MNIKLWLALGFALSLSACQQGDRPPVTGVVDLVVGDALTSQALISSGLRFDNPSTSFEALNDTCYLSTTYNVTNSTGRNLANLSLVAINRASNVAGTAVSGLRGAAGNTVTNPAIYRSIRPSHRLIAVGNQAQVVAGAADFQVFLPTEVAALQTDVSAIAADAVVLEYGYVARNSGGSRVLRDGDTGTVTIAVQYPCETGITGGTPFSFAMTFAFTDVAIPRFTRGPNETLAALEQRIINTYGAAAIPANVEILLVGDDNEQPLFGNLIRVSNFERIADIPLPSPIPAFVANVQDPQVYGFTCADDEVNVSSSGATQLSFGNTVIYAGTRQVAANNQDPRLTRFDKGEQVWCLGSLETSSEDSRGYGLLWDGADTLYALFSMTGAQSEPTTDFRRFAVNGWLPSYGAGGGVRAAVLVRIDLVSGSPLTATYLSARQANGDTSALTVTDLALTSAGDVIVRAETSAFPRSTNPNVTIDCPAFDGLVADYTLVLSADLSTAISATAPSCRL
jgi:hypothetical protein